MMRSLRWRTLALLAIAELLGMSLWFSGSAVVPALAREWNLSRKRRQLANPLSSTRIRGRHASQRAVQSSRHHQFETSVRVDRDRGGFGERRFRIVRPRCWHSDHSAVLNGNVSGRSLSAGDEDSGDVVSLRSRSRTRCFGRFADTRQSGAVFDQWHWQRELADECRAGFVCWPWPVR